MRWLRVAAKESLKSNYKYKVGAVLVKGGRIIARGHNEVRLKSTGCRRYSKWMESLHAERACVTKVDKDEVRGGIIYIFRHNGHGKSALAKPCPQCLWMLNDLGIKRIIYSINTTPFYEVI